MSFVAGFVTGLTAGEVVERRKDRSQFREYMESRGYTIIDRAGRQIPLTTVIDESMQPKKERSSHRILVVGAVLVTVVVFTGGTAWITLAVV
jgi:hypothetical protein